MTGIAMDERRRSGRRRGAPPERGGPSDGPDMTPMIDVTFQLVVFFLVANDLTRKEVVDLSLPQALHGVKDDDGETRIVVNLERPADLERAPEWPRVTVRGESLAMPQFLRVLQARADLEREDAPGRPSTIHVLIRADRAAPWRHVQTIIQACASERIGIYKVQFATTRGDAAAAAAPGRRP